MKALVSILIPAYNAETWIADTLRSALAQTWPNTEIIVVDDGSKDQTLAVVQGFASAKLKVVTQENQGAAATRNKAWSLCQGDYVQWLDADDLLSPDKVGLQMEAAERCGSRRTALSSGWGYFRYRPHAAKFIPTPLWEDLTPLEWLTRKMELTLHMQTATWLTSRELTQVAGLWNTQLLGDDDGEYFARVLLAADAVKFVPGARVYYRISPASRLSYIGNSQRKMEAQLASMQTNIRYLRSLDDSPRVRAACLEYLRVWQPAFYSERSELVAKARQLAVELGGNLPPPTFSWKYAWIQHLFGWSAASRTRMRYNECKCAVLRWWDKSLHALESRRHIC